MDESMFGPSSNHLDNAYTDLHGDISTHDLAIAYKESADILMDRLQNAPYGYVDRHLHIYPVAFLYRHSVELQLKAIIEKCKSVKKSQDTKPRLIHGLSDLFEQAKEEIDSVFTKETGSVDISLEEKVVQHLNDLDSSSMTFRYSLDRKGKSQRSHIKGLSLEKLSRAMKSFAYNTKLLLADLEHIGSNRS